MNFCASCGKPAPPNTAYCQHCGTPLLRDAIATMPPASSPTQFGPQQFSATGTEDKRGTYWLPIPSMIIGIIYALSLFDTSKWDKDTISGAGVLCMAGLTLGIISISRQRKGKPMAVAGVVLSSVGLLALLARLP